MSETSELFHFSEDPTIECFVPHVPPTNPTQAPAVWAIDAQHAPLYWFPRDCPRVTAWPRNQSEQAHFEAAFQTTAHRVHGIEHGWLNRMRTVQLFRYSFDAAPFQQWADASGQWISTESIVPRSVAPVGSLLDLHVQAAIELRICPSLWPLHDMAISDRWEFSIVRMRNATARP